MNELPQPIWEVDRHRPRVPNAAVEGIMKHHVGPPLQVDEVLTSTDAPLHDIDRITLIRAYPVISLINRMLPETIGAGIAGELQAMLCEELPGWEWRVPSTCWIPKFHICHTCIPAPPQGRDVIPMALEIYGRAVAIDGEHVRPFSPLDLSRMTAVGTGCRRTLIRIVAATYSNVAWLGHQTPFYS